MKPTLDLQQDLADMLRELQSAGAEFVIVGGFAVAAWGHLRSTKDLDVFVRPTPENARAVLRALIRFGAPLHDLAERDLAEPGTVSAPRGPHPVEDARGEKKGDATEAAPLTLYWRNTITYTS